MTIKFCLIIFSVTIIYDTKRMTNKKYNAINVDFAEFCRIIAGPLFIINSLPWTCFIKQMSRVIMNKIHYNEKQRK